MVYLYDADWNEVTFIHTNAGFFLVRSIRCRLSLLQVELQKHQKQRHLAAKKRSLK